MLTRVEEGIKKDFLELSRDCFWEVDQHLAIKYVSPQIEDMIGRPPEYYLGKKIGHGLNCDLRTNLWQEFEENLRLGKAVSDFSFSFFRKDGREAVMSISTHPMIDKNGMVVGHRMCAREILQSVTTRTVENGKPRGEIEQRLADTLESVPHGVALFDHNDCLVFLNNKYQDIFPEVQDMLVPGATMEDIIRVYAERGVQSFAPNETAEDFIQKRMALHRNGYGVREIQLRNGAWVEVSEHDAAQDCVVLAWTDITHIKNRERALSSLLGDDVSNWSVQERAAKAAAQALGCRWAGVVRLGDGHSGELVSFWDTNELKATFNYDINQSICRHVYDCGDLYSFKPSGDVKTVQSPLFKGYGDDVLSYHGLALSDMRGRYAGHLFVASDKEEANDSFGINEEVFRLIGRWVEMEFRRQAIHEKMVYSQQRFRDFAEVASDWFWEMDSDLRYKFISEHAGIESQSSLQEVILRAHRELSGDFDSSETALIDSTVSDNKIKAHQPFRDVTFTVNDKDSGRERTLKISGRPIFDDKGIFMGYRGTGSDVTEMVEAMSRANRAEGWLKNAIETSPEAFALYDKEDKLVICNQKFKDAFFAGIQDLVQPNMSFEELLRLHIAKGPKDENITNSEDFLERRLKSRREDTRLPSWESQINGRHLRAMEHRTDDGGIACFYIDITDLRENEKKLTEAKEAAEVASRGKSDFLANVSHELRTPLNAIIGFSELIRDDLAGPVNGVRYKEYVNDIHSSGRHLLELINDILDLSKAEAGQIKQYAEIIDIRDVVSTSITIIRQRAEEAQVSLHVDIDNNVPNMYLDPKRFRQIMLNLLSNSVKFTPEGGDVTVKARLLSDGVEIDVIDTGIGMAKEDLPKALSSFGQVDSSLSRKYEGTGLGLPLTKKLVEGAGGTLDIESELGKGTTVKLSFPKSCLR